MVPPLIDRIGEGVDINGYKINEARGYLARKMGVAKYEVMIIYMVNFDKASCHGNGQNLVLQLQNLVNETG